MSLTELSSRAAVLAALREFDERGRELFLSNYGFNYARSYFLSTKAPAMIQRLSPELRMASSIRIWGHFVRQTSAAAKPQSRRCLRDSDFVSYESLRVIQACGPFVPTPRGIVFARLLSI